MPRPTTSVRRSAGSPRRDARGDRGRPGRLRHRPHRRAGGLRRRNGGGGGTAREPCWRAPLSGASWRAWNGGPESAERARPLSGGTGRTAVRRGRRRARHRDAMLGRPGSGGPADRGSGTPPGRPSWLGSSGLRRLNTGPPFIRPIRRITRVRERANTPGRRRGRPARPWTRRTVACSRCTIAATASTGTSRLSSGTRLAATASAPCAQHLAAPRRIQRERARPVHVAHRHRHEQAAPDRPRRHRRRPAAPRPPAAAGSAPAPATCSSSTRRPSARPSQIWPAAAPAWPGRNRVEAPLHRGGDRSRTGSRPRRPPAGTGNARAAPRRRRPAGPPARWSSRAGRARRTTAAHRQQRESGTAAPSDAAPAPRAAAPGRRAGEGRAAAARAATSASAGIGAVGAQGSTVSVPPRARGIATLRAACRPGRRTGDRHAAHRPASTSSASATPSSTWWPRSPRTSSPRTACARGSMTLIDAERADALYAAMPPGQESSGGSAANTCAVAAGLGARVAYLGRVADDQLGAVFRHDIAADRRAFPDPAADRRRADRALPDPGDAGRAADHEHLSRRLRGVRAGARWMTPCRRLRRAATSRASCSTRRRRRQAFRAAPRRRARGRPPGGAVAVRPVLRRTATATPSCELVAGYVDILFANEAEITSLYQTDSFAEAIGAGARGGRTGRADPQRAGQRRSLQGTRDGRGRGRAGRRGRHHRRGRRLCGGLPGGPDRRRRTSPNAAASASIAAAEIIGHYGARPLRDLSGERAALLA